MDIDKGDFHGIDLGLIYGTGIDSVSYGFGTSDVGDTEPPTEWGLFPPKPGDKAVYLWMYIKLLLTDGTSSMSEPAIIGVIPSNNYVVGD